ncbi:MAG: hypothetical protein IH840_00965 [Candidatus Heimdallarchaeota archaeon]|nr:hypothetical protein [Candidatus Heimdallarchaeota archaeon]
MGKEEDVMPKPKQISSILVQQTLDTIRYQKKRRNLSLAKRISLVTALFLGLGIWTG